MHYIKYHKNNKDSRLEGSFKFPNLLKGLHALGNLGLVDDTRAAHSLEGGPCLIHAPEVGGPTQVLARVLTEHPVHDQSHVAKVVDWSKAIFWSEKWETYKEFAVSWYSYTKKN